MPGGADPLGVAREYQVRGRDFMAVGKPRAAERVLRRALRLAEAATPGPQRAETAARIHITLANAEFELHGLPVALARLDVAARIVTEHGLVAVRISLQNQRGLLALRAGRPADAVRAFDAAAPYWDDAPVNERCYVLLNRSVAHMELSSLAAARRDLFACATAAHAAGLRVVERKAVHNLGYVASWAGDLPEALRLMDAAAEIDADSSAVIDLQTRAQALTEAGLIREADEALAAAVVIARRDRLGRDLAIVELDRARCALALGEPASATRLARSARNRLRARRDLALSRMAELVLAQAQLAAGRADARTAESAARLRDEWRLERLRLLSRAAGHVEAEARLARGQVDAASATLAGLGAPRRDDPITGRMHWHYVSARVDAAAGRPAAATRRIRRALDELARYQASFGSIDLRTASAVHGRRLAELDIALALTGGRAAPVFAAAERARAVSSRLPTVRPPADPVAADLLAELRQLLDALRAVELDRAASEPLLRQRRELERRIVARSWTLAGTGAVDRPAPLADVRGALAEGDRILISFVQAAGNLCAVVVGRRVRRYDLGPVAPVVERVRRVRADHDVLAQPRLPGAVRATALASARRSLAALDVALLRPLRTDGPLVLVSTGVLGQLPWGSLPSLRGRPLVVAPSATKWLASTRSAPAGRTEVVALAGPDLARGDDEATAVGAAWRSALVHRGPAATTAALTAAMASATVLHVAAHGVHQAENPLFSSVRMADGPVFAHELDRAARTPEHVVLSACDVGLATVRPGDEALGLASVLLHLGTRSVVAGVARVGDELAAQTMASYHGRLAAGRDSSVALAEALSRLDADVVPPFVNFGAAWAPNLEPASPVA